MSATWTFLRIFFVFFLNTTLKVKFSKFCSKVFIVTVTPTDVLCSNFVKFGRQEKTKKKQQNFAWLFSRRYCADRAQNLPGPAHDNVLRVLQISSKSAHFRRSCSRTRGHCQNAPKSDYPIFGRSLASSRIISRGFACDGALSTVVDNTPIHWLHLYLQYIFSSSIHRTRTCRYPSHVVWR